MKRYQSHKVVEAARIVAAEKQEDGRWHFVHEDGTQDTCTIDEAPRFRITEQDMGYVVRYPDGYVSWSPSLPFEQGYSDLTPVDPLPEVNLSFSEALAAVKIGHRLQRAGWNGKGMFVFLVAGSVFKVNREPLLSILGEGTEVQYHGHIDMRTADGTIVPWLASQTDLLAEDWQIVRDLPA